MLNVTALAWVWLGVVQLVSLVAMVAGWFILPLPCALRAWRPARTTVGPVTTTDAWRWPLNFVYGNPSSDGVSGACALIWDGGKRVPYMPGSNPSWRAYLWSAWRNSADNLKYVFAWERGPFFSRDYVLRGHYGALKAGWQRENGVKVPVLSL